MRRVVVTGMGIVSSIGNNVAEVTDSLLNVRSGITFSPKQAEMGFRSQVHAVPTCDPSTIFDRRALRFMGPGPAWAAVAMKEAIEMAGLSPADISNERVGIIAGSGGPSTSAIVNSVRLVDEKKRTKPVGPLVVPKTMSSGVSACLAVMHKIRGFNISISSACATSAHCIGEAAIAIAQGRQDRVFAGGCEEDDYTLSLAFDAMPAMSSGFNDRPTLASRAYDKDRDGFVIAGGAGILVLEALEVAQARGAHILGEVVGYGLTSDGDDMVQPSGEGAVRCMRMAIEGLGGIPRKATTRVDYVNTHGTSTPIGDEKEIAALTQVFGMAMPPLSSTKSLTGHSLGAAGVQEAIYCLVMIRNRFLVESANIQELDPSFSGVPILRTTLTGVDVETVLSNSFGFGGTNATLIFRRFAG